MPLTLVCFRPGQVVLMQYQAIHGIGHNLTKTDRVQVYFRVTASTRPQGKIVAYPEAMKDVLLETPALSAWRQDVASKRVC